MPNFAIKSSTVILFMLLLALTPAVAFADAESIFKENSKAVVVIVTFDSKGEAIAQGSGFIVRADGAIVTNYHVISNASDIKVKVGDKILDVEDLIYTDIENDIVILKAKGVNLPIVKLGDIEKETIGETLYVISSPQGLENTISDGILSGVRDITSENKVLQITAPISSGSSGSPVFNKNGEVIGIVTFLLKESQNLNFAMPINLIKDKISDKKTIALKDADIVDYEKTAKYWFYLGYYLVEIKSYNEAIDAYKQAIKINPDFAEVYAHLGLTYLGVGRYQEAVDASKLSIKINPDLAGAHIGLGHAYRNLGRYQEAVDAFKQAIRIKPDFADAHIGLGYAYRGLGRDQEAVDAFKQAIRINPDLADAHHNLGFVYGKLGRYQESVDAYKQAIRITPDYVDAHNNLGFTYILLGDKGSALEEYKILKNLDKELANKLFNLIYK